MDHPQGRIAVPHAVHNDAHRKQVIDLVQRLVLILHLLIDAEKVLHAPVYLRLDARIPDMLADLVHDALDILLPHALAHGYLVYKVIIHVRLQIFQRQVVQFDLHLADAQPLGDGAIDFQRLLGDALPALGLLVLQRPHIVEPVRQLDQDDPDIFRHGKEHLPEILRLHLQLGVRLVSPCRQRNLLQLRDAVHQKRHIVPELPLQILLRHDGVLHHVMENPRYDRLLVQLQIRQNDRHVQRMDDVRLA